MKNFYARCFLIVTSIATLAHPISTPTTVATLRSNGIGMVTSYTLTNLNCTAIISGSAIVIKFTN